MKTNIVVLLLWYVSSLSCTLYAQSKVKATGTGQTTGHIANLTVYNDGKTDIRINEQTVYIPSDGGYQPYITTIPGTTIPPGVSTIPLDGYCADVTTPPVPPGDGMPPVDDWIAIDPVTRPGPDLVNIVDQTVPRFTIESIPGITESTGYTPKPPPTMPGIGLTWPGTDIIVGGVLNPDEDPTSTAPVLIEALQKIENAFDSLRGEGVINTPFSGDPPRERESVIQQTFWFYAAGLSGKRYQKEDFAGRVIEQYENNVGIAVSKIPESERNKIDEGVDAFWNTFTAVGVEAKVLQAAESTTITPATTALNPTEPDPNDPPVLIKGEEKKCECDTMHITLTVSVGGKDGALDPEGVGNQTAIYGTGKSKALKEITAVYPKVEIGASVKLTPLATLKCTCSNGGAICPVGSSPVTTIKQGNTDLTNPFNIKKVPIDIDVKVTQTCVNDDCQIATCSVTIPVKIREETKAEKTAREKKEQEEKDKAEEEKAEKEKAEKGKKGKKDK